MENEPCLLCKKMHPPLVVLHASPEDSAEQWARDTAILAQTLADMHRLAFGSFTPAAVAELARDCMGSKPPDSSLLARCLRAIGAEKQGPECERMQVIADMDAERVALLAASVHGVLTGLGEAGAR